MIRTGNERDPPARAALWSSVGAGFATLFDGAVIAFTPSSVAVSLDATPSDIQWYLAAYSLTFGLGLVPSGRLGDAYGRRRLLVVGLAVFIAGLSLCALAPSVAPLISGRFLQGLGAGCISAQVLGLLQDHFTGSDRIRALGAYTAAGAAAAIAGPLLAGIALGTAPDEWAWRAVLLLPAPLALAVIVIALRGLPRDHRARRGAKLDLPGIILLGVIVVLLTLPVIDPGLDVRETVAVLALAGILGAALVSWERSSHRRGGSPLFAPALMRSPGFLAGCLIASLWFGSLLAATTVLTMTLLQNPSMSAITVALLLLPAAFGRLLGARSSARLFSAHGSSIIALGITCEAACLATMAVAAAALPATGFAITAAALHTVMGYCGGVVEPTLRARTLAGAPVGMGGLAASFLQLTQRLSATFVVALASGILLVRGISGHSAAAVMLLCALIAAASALATRLRSFR